MDMTIRPHRLIETNEAAHVQTSDKPERIIGLLILLVALGGFGFWALLAPLDGAVITSGVVAVESARKTLQHLDGGVVSEIHAHESLFRKFI
ncbi:hypothetical protein [uncultured Thiocystis sp.]|jgi:epimerase transport system membrane fusion protein|uniref:hypothetical protein n=1 Tax=uncultured Thiocystis sp. TaxID=1202134 RepID=UPI0025CE609E|nr:hypothetical protein [uncultured Thiocystis sp.]